jgi:hypothetical protein
VDIFEISTHDYYYQAVKSAMNSIMLQLITVRSENKMAEEYLEDDNS